MTFIRRQTLTPKEANKLHKLGFILSFKYSLSKFWDVYDVYVKG